ncbi:MAG: ATP-binding protein [Paracoccaceae bacterium]
MTVPALATVALAYSAFLFAIAFAAERRARQGRWRFLRRSTVYTLSLSVYCTAWTFYGAVGYAARSGFEYLTIYLGPTLVMIGWWWLLRKLVRVGRTQRVTSIADLVSSRFGKSTALGVAVTLIAVVGTTPYIALQLQSVALSAAAFTGDEGAATGLWVAAGLALFAILFGTRTLDSSERHNGIVIAVAVEAVVKLGALLAVGVFAVWGIGGGIEATAARIDAAAHPGWEQPMGRWTVLIAISAAAVFCLPRMFQVLVVENTDERHLAAASWAFPAYLLAMSVFVMPIAALGMERLPDANPDLYVLALPLSEGASGLALLAFLGGFSSATSMVIVATVALATMVSNHVVTPVWLARAGRGAQLSGDLRGVVVRARRIAIAAVLGLGYLYFDLAGGGALAAIGLVSFTGMAQIAPAILAGLYWRAATRTGAMAGLVAGALTWGWTLLLPAILGDPAAPILADGPWGIGWLRPQSLLGLGGDPLVHGVLWSLGLNVAALFVGSVLTFPSPMERLQGAQYVHVFRHSGPARPWAGAGAGAEELLIMSQRILGGAQAQRLFADEAARQGGTGYLPVVSPEFLSRLERVLAGSVGAATAHAMVGQLTEGASVSVEDLMAVADETAQMRQTSTRLALKSTEAETTASALRAANAKLTRLAAQKDAFLGQISHELRTPMTSIRSFSDILREGGGDEAARARHAGIIHDEAVRMTRLLDDLLDLTVLESGQVTLHPSDGSLRQVVDRALAVAGAGMEVVRDREAEARVALFTDLDRLVQVFVNLIANAAKYCDAEAPRLTVRLAMGGRAVDVIDNGSGIPAEARDMVFEKFARLDDHRATAGGAGLGLSICREVMSRLGGSIDYLPGQGGAAFRIRLPPAPALLDRTPRSGIAGQSERA